MLVSELKQTAQALLYLCSTNELVSHEITEDIFIMTNLFFGAVKKE